MWTLGETVDDIIESLSDELLLLEDDFYNTDDELQKQKLRKAIMEYEDELSDFRADIQKVIFKFSVGQ